MQDQLTVEDLDRVFIRAQNDEGRWVTISAKEATDRQFHAWATSRMPVEGSGEQWLPEDRADFCNVLYRHGALHILKKEVEE